MGLRRWNRTRQLAAADRASYFERKPQYFLLPLVRLY
jgi:hypothetical protein